MESYAELSHDGMAETSSSVRELLAVGEEQPQEGAGLYTSGSSIASEIGVVDHGVEGLVSLNSSTSTIMDDDSRNISEQLLFFGCGLGSSIGYIATLSSLVYFKVLYGPNSFVDLNLAVYVPLLPIALAQARWDQYYDRQFQSRRTFFFRGTIGFGLTLIGTIQMTITTGGVEFLIWNALLQGTGGAILFGTLNQLASFCSRDGKRLQAAVSAGVQSSALIVLGVTWLSGFGTHNGTKFPTFLWGIISIEVLCFSAFLWLLTGRPTVMASMTRRDSAIQFEAIASLVDESNMSAPLIPETEQRESSRSVEQSFSELWRYSQACCSTLLVVLIPSFLVGSWFTRVHTAWMDLAQVLFYVRIALDFVGRLATIIVPPRSVVCLQWTAYIRLLPVLLFFINARGIYASDGSSDYISILLVGIIAFLSGYIVTGCFQLAPQGIPEEIRESNVSKQVSLLTVAFSVAALGGLISSFALIAFGV